MPRASAASEADLGDRLQSAWAIRAIRDPTKTRVRARTDPDGDQVDSLHPPASLAACSFRRAAPRHVRDRAGGRDEPLANALVAARRRDGEITRLMPSLMTAGGAP